MFLRTLIEKSAALSSRCVTSRELVKASLAAATEPSGEGSRAFTKLYAESALSAAESCDRQRQLGIPGGPLMGLPISIKDLFDVTGETTTAGSIVLSEALPAQRDSVVVERLRAAGAVLIGRTNMTEFAYSGLGLNPHYGTPRNPYDRIGSRIPGGSSSGAAISVSDGMAAAAVGTDTGGSVRIPAALCGLIAYKPTACRVPLEGVYPLSRSLDSVGCIAPTVPCCALLDSVLSGENFTPMCVSSVAAVRFGILQGYVLDGLDEHVTLCFNYAVDILSDAGAEILEIRFNALDEIAEVNANGGFPAAESYQWHRQLIEHYAESYDPRVLSRILRGKQISKQAYQRLGRVRSRVISDAARAFADCDVWLSPTVPRVAPLIAELQSSIPAYIEANAAMLRNPSVVNFLDGCALSIPCHKPGEAPVGLMVASLGGRDQQLLTIGGAIETMLASAGLAVHSHAVVLSHI